ncbi:hypothetical protein T484DRAFT_1836395, partial [Baffinella frigidus]
IDLAPYLASPTKTTSPEQQESAGVKPVLGESTGANGSNSNGEKGSNSNGGKGSNDKDGVEEEDLASEHTPPFCDFPRKNLTVAFSGEIKGSNYGAIGAVDFPVLGAIVERPVRNLTDAFMGAIKGEPPVRGEANGSNAPVEKGSNDAAVGAIDGDILKGETPLSPRTGGAKGSNVRGGSKGSNVRGEAKSSNYADIGAIDIPVLGAILETPSRPRTGEAKGSNIPVKGSNYADIGAIAPAPGVQHAFVRPDTPGVQHAFVRPDMKGKLRVDAEGRMAQADREGWLKLDGEIVCTATREEAVLKTRTTRAFQSSAPEG